MIDMVTTIGIKVTDSNLAREVNQYSETSFKFERTLKRIGSPFSKRHSGEISFSFTAH